MAKRRPIDPPDLTAILTEIAAHPGLKAGACAAISVTTRGSVHTLVKIEDASGREVTRGFIRAGGTHRFNLPLVSYVLKTASGQTWYGPEPDRLFGPGDLTQTNRADDRFDLNAPGEYWTVELIPRQQGNLREVRIPRTAF